MEDVQGDSLMPLFGGLGPARADIPKGCRGAGGLLAGGALWRMVSVEREPAREIGQRAHARGLRGKRRFWSSDRPPRKPDAPSSGTPQFGVLRDYEKRLPGPREEEVKNTFRRGGIELGNDLAGVVISQGRPLFAEERWTILDGEPCFVGVERAIILMYCWLSCCFGFFPCVVCRAGKPLFPCCLFHHLRPWIPTTLESDHDVWPALKSARYLGTYVAFSSLRSDSHVLAVDSDRRPWAPIPVDDPRAPPSSSDRRVQPPPRAATKCCLL